MESFFLLNIADIFTYFQSWSPETRMFALFFVLFSLCLLTVLSFFETVFFSLPEKEISEIRDFPGRRNKKLKFFLESPKQTLGVVVLGYYVFLVLSVFLLVILLVQLLALTVIPVFLQWIIIFLSVTFSVLLFSEFFPEWLKRKKRMGFLCATSGLVRILYFIFYPLVKILLYTTTIIEKRLETKTYRNISIDELSETLYLKEVEKKEEKDILQGIVNFGRINVDEIMKPRVDIVDIDIKSDFETVIRIIRESEYSRLPVYQDSIDNVKGILYIKDLLNYIDRENSFNWQALIREAYFIPETKKIDDLLKEFQTKRIHMAVVVDEFGGTAGIVTLEDILEVIVGDICDEHDDEQKLYTLIDEKTYVLEGKLLLNEFYKIPSVEKDKFENIDSDADTLAGLILEIKGDIPVIGEEIDYNGYKFQIVSADNRRIKKVKLQIP